MALKKFLKSFIQEEEGATAVEYGIMIALIAAVIIGVVTSIGLGTKDTYNFVSNSIGSS